MSDKDALKPQGPLRLTEDHVRRVTRLVDGPRHNPDWRLMDDDDLDRLAQRLTAGRPAPVEIFAYGSLIWNPGFPVAARRRATARNWHRQFSIDLEHFRGSPEQPGLMLALASGGSCEGVLLEIAPATTAEALRAVLRRELVAHELAANFRWIEVETGGMEREALTFYADPVDVTLTDLPIEEQARRLAHANGAAGSGSEYLLRTAQSLEEAGIHDGYIWELQALVAEEIDRWSGMEGKN
ncbi:gamma-glutamylcyclotransferase [Paracoccus aminophilus]|nr:gamma-glutamylcyclotransferase [Paracoccus aminophilus]